MRALQFHEYGGPGGAGRSTRSPNRTPGPTRSGSRWPAASVNPIDWKMRAGTLAGGKDLAAPAGLGFDAAGVVDEVGEDVTGVAVGDDVFGLGSNTQAEYAVLDRAR